MPSPDLDPSERGALDAVAADLERVFAGRLRSLVAYRSLEHGATHVHSLALLDSLTFRDLSACVSFVDDWHRRGAAVPILLSEEEFRRSLDIFPLEYGSIIAGHVLIRGRNPFDGVAVAAEDLRRACEAQAKSHVIHLREAYLETHGEPSAVASLIAASAAPFRSILANLARLPGGPGTAPSDAPHLSDESLARATEARVGIPATVVRDVLASATSGQTTIAEPTAVLARYIDAAERVWEYADAWKA